MVIKPSVHFVILLLLSHAAAASVVCVTAVPLAARLVMLMPVLLSLFYYLARDVLSLLSDSWHEILLDQDRVQVVVRGGSDFSGQVANRTMVSPGFIVLRVRPGKHHLPVSRVIFPDAIGRDAFRELCVRLKFA